MRKIFRQFQLLIIVSILSVNIQGFAQENTPWEWRPIAGKVQQNSNLYLQQIDGFPTYEGRMDFELEFGVTNTIWTIKALPWAWGRFPDAVGGIARKTRGFFELKEGWVEYVKPEFDIRVGNQLIAWGSADQINPTDLWNPRDRTDLLDSTKLPLFTVRANIHPQEWSQFNLEILFSPLFRENRLPVVFPDDGVSDLLLSASRWLAPAPTIVVADSLSAPLIYKVSSPNYPATWQAGARLQLLSVGGWDFSFSALNNIEQNPRFSIARKGSALDPRLPITLTLNPSFHRQQMWGIDASGSMQVFETDFGLRFESAYVQRSNARVDVGSSDLIKDDFIHAVQGVDHTFEGKLFDTVVYMNFMFVEYARVTNRGEGVGKNVLIQGLPNVDPWDYNAVLYLEDRIGSEYKFTTTALSSMQNKDIIATPAFHWQLKDNLKSILSADFFLGSKNGFFGQFHENRRVKLKFEWVF